MKRLNTLVAVILVMVFVHTNNAQISQKSFHFKIESANDTYDSKTQIFERLYTRGTEAYHIKFTDEELKKIYELLKRSRFSQFPKEFKPSGEGMVIEVVPSFRYIIRSNHLGKTKTVLYNDRTTDSLMREEGKPFLKVYRDIWEIIRSNSEVKKLQKSDVFWE